MSRNRRTRLHPCIRILDDATYLIETDKSSYLMYIEEVKTNYYTLIIGEVCGLKDGFFCFSKEIFNTSVFDVNSPNHYMDWISSGLVDGLVEIENPFELALNLGGYLKGDIYKIPNFHTTLN